MTNATAHAVTVCQRGHQRRSGATDMIAKVTAQKAKGVENCISIGQRVPEIHTLEPAARIMVGPTMQALISSAKPRDCIVGRACFVPAVTVARSKRNEAAVKNAKTTTIKREPAMTNH